MPDYIPPTLQDGFYILLCRNYSPPNAIAKNIEIIETGTHLNRIYCVMRNDSSIINPVILIEYEDFLNLECNFVLFDGMGKRHYFVNDIICVNKNLYELHLSVDVLSTYNFEIIHHSGYVDRCEYFDYMDKTDIDLIIDKKRTILQGFDVEEEEIENLVFQTGFIDGDVDDALYVVTGYKLDVVDNPHS